jgi:hypothetical protein
MDCPKFGLSQTTLLQLISKRISCDIVRKTVFQTQSVFQLWVNFLFSKDFVEIFVDNLLLPIVICFKSNFVRFSYFGYFNNKILPTLVPCKYIVLMVGNVNTKDSSSSS